MPTSASVTVLSGCLVPYGLRVVSPSAAPNGEECCGRDQTRGARRAPRSRRRAGSSNRGGGGSLGWSTLERPCASAAPTRALLVGVSQGRPRDIPCLPWGWCQLARLALVALAGLEPATSGLWAQRASELLHSALTTWREPRRHGPLGYRIRCLPLIRRWPPGPLSPTETAGGCCVGHGLFRISDGTLSTLGVQDLTEGVASSPFGLNGSLDPVGSGWTEHPHYESYRSRLRSTTRARSTACRRSPDHQDADLQLSW